jgi:hypothetical protein
MSRRKAVIDIVLCLLLFTVGFWWYVYTIFVGGAYKSLVLKALMFMGAVVLGLDALRQAMEGDYCLAALLDGYAVLMVIGAVFGL